MSLSNLLHGTVSRMAGVCALIFALSGTSVLLVSQLQLTRDIEGRLKARVLATRDALLALYSDGNADALARAISSQVSSFPNAGTVLFLVDHNGKVLAGNVRSAPEFSRWRTLTWSRLALAAPPHPSLGTGAVSIWTAFPNARLLVGQDNHELQQSKAILFSSLSLTIAIALAAVGFAALIGGLRTENRLADIDETLRSVAHGHLQTRLELAGSDDDLDRVGKQINVMLDGVERHVVRLRNRSADIAHELRTPLGRIRQRLELAGKTSSTVDDVRELVTSAIVELDSTLETFDALLRIAQIEAGERKARFRPVDLADLVARVAQTYQSVAEDARHKMTVNINPDASRPLCADAALITQLCANLIENAIRHCSPGSSIEVDLRSDDREWILKISDNGPGIPVGARKKVFDPLYRIRGTRTNAGTGLGLSLVAAIANLHDAAIELGDNSPGLVATIRFPVPSSLRPPMTGISLSRRG